MPLSNHETKQIGAITRKAGEALLAHWSGRDRLAVDTKADGSSVSEADMASNAILMKGLAELFPDDAILSEESPPPQNLDPQRRLWIIDPLDGTKSFLNGIDDFSILVALCEQGIPRFGIMHFPARDWLVVAAKGQGASLDGVTLRVSDAPKIRNERLYTRNFDAPSDERVFRGSMDSGMAFLEVARGGLDAVVIRMTHHKEWDLASPCLAIEESGGQVTDEKGRHITYGRPSIEFEFLIATNGRVHAEALSIANGDVLHR